MRLKKRLMLNLAALSFTTFTSLALASGSDAIGSAQTGATADYNKGKRIYAVKIACKTCPMSGKKLNKSVAQKLLNQGAGTSLTAAENHSLQVYLKRRFKL